MSKRVLEGEEEVVEEIEDADAFKEEKEGDGNCPCKMCPDDMEAVLKRLEQLVETNVRVVNQLAKETFDNKNAMMSLLSKLMTSVEEMQADHLKLAKRQDKFREILELEKKRQKTDGGHASGGEEGDGRLTLELEKRLATMQDIIVKGFAKLK